MKQSKWTILALALAMMAVTGAALQRTGGTGALEAPGVKVGTAPLYSETGRLIANRSVVMPKDLPGWSPVALPITEVEANTLPADTTFGRRGYLKDGFQVEASVVLMGEDRASIHRPQWCLVGAGWTIDRTEKVTVPMQAPYRYELPVNKLTMSLVDRKRRLGGVYVYWYVSKDKVMSEHLGRLWSTTRAALTTGVRERWAYVSYFASCLPGQEQATFERLEKVIQSTVPEFQLVAGPRATPLAVMSPQN
jgi:hypothetical protein